MSAESDARKLAELRKWRSDIGLITHDPGYRLPVFYLEQFDLLLRIADERDQLHRELCEEQQGRGRRPITSVPSSGGTS